MSGGERAVAGLAGSYVPSVPADWPAPPPGTIQDALDELAAGVSPGATGAGVLVFQPGGVAGGNVYVTFAALYAALQARRAVGFVGPVTVGVDSSIAAAHVLASATPYGLDDVTFVSAVASEAATLTFDDGATIAASTINLSFRTMTVVGAAVSPHVTWSPPANALLSLDNVFLEETASGAFLDATTSIVEILATNGSIVGDGTHTVALVETAGTFQINAFTGSSIQAAAVARGALAGGTFNVNADGSTRILQTSAAGLTVQILVQNPQPTFVFRPGATGVQNGNVYTTWAALMAAANLSGAAPRTCFVDDSIAPAHVTTGAWNIDNFLFRSERATQTATLHIDEGTVFTCSRFELLDSLIFQSEATATVPLVSATAANKAVRIYTRNNAVLKSTTAIAFMQQSAGGSIALVADEGTAIGDGTHPVITTDAGLTSTFQIFAKTAISAHALAGLGTTVVTKDASATVNATQDVSTLTTSLADLAAQVSYTPGVGGNWNPVPTLASAALDQLAAQNVVQASGNTGTGTGTVTAGATGNITKAKSGLVLVIATLAGTTSAGTTITGQLVRDAATNIGAVAVATTLSATDGFELTIAFVDTLPDNAAHTYKMTGTAGAGNIVAGGATSFQISAVEL